MLKKWKLFRGLAVVFCFLFVLMIGITQIGKENEGSVSRFFGIGAAPAGELTAENTIYKTDFTEDGVPTKEGLNKLVDAADDYVTQVSEEGSVLLKNDKAGEAAALPLAEKAKVSLFGQAFKSPYYRGISNGANFDLTRGINPLKAFKSVFTVNEELVNSYGTGGDGMDVTASQVEGYKEAAIVMLARQDGEGSDVDDANRELALNDNEKKMLQQVQSLGFDKIIVLLNSGYPMETEALDNYGVDAVLWIGYPGVTGFQGVANILAGKANPSGRLVDTYAKDSLSSPAMRNFGNFSFENGGGTYLIYAEGIYVGYKYYETRYEDAVLNRFNAAGSAGVYSSAENKWNYADEVTYPFGYGLSYTTFTQEFDGEPAYDEATDTFTVKVKVTNTGAVAGKSVVQVYAQMPYIKGGVEKSAIQLVGFEKTDELAPAGKEGSSATVTVSIDRYLLASYDVNARGGEGGYILDAGDYYLAVGDDAHDALNNVLAAKGASGMYDQNGKAVTGNAAKAWEYTLDERDEESYKLSDTGVEVNNKFTDDPLYSTDYNYFNPGKITYLTRSDWNTYPKSYTGLSSTDAINKIHDGNFQEDLKPEKVPAKSDFEQGVTGEELIKFYRMNGVPLTGTYTDKNGVQQDAEKVWEQFLNQLTVEEMAILTADDFGIKAVESVGFPVIINQDGPDGVRGMYLYNKTLNATLFNNVGLLAATFDKELYSLRGYYTGEDCIYTGVSQYWGPGFNNHRTPYGGRNFEYVSEDSVVSYVMAAEVAGAMTEKGVICAPKHLAGNDQETNRSGVMTFMTEQTLREITLRSFEGAYTIGHTKGTMTSYNALGACYTARNSALMNEVVRGEWGFDGMFITDAGSCTDTPVTTLASGTDMFCLGGTMNTAVAKDVNGQTDGFGIQTLRNTAKRIIYVYANSIAVNGLSEDTVVSNVTPWWLASLYALDAVFGVIAVASIAMFIYTGYIRKKEVNKNV